MLPTQHYSVLNAARNAAAADAPQVIHRAHLAGIFSGCSILQHFPGGDVATLHFKATNNTYWIASYVPYHTDLENFVIAIASVYPSPLPLPAETAYYDARSRTCVQGNSQFRGVPPLGRQKNAQYNVKLSVANVNSRRNLAIGKSNTGKPIVVVQNPGGGAKVRTGPRGGRFVIKAGKKVYV
jgi:hypothetical protein